MSRLTRAVAALAVVLTAGLPLTACAAPAAEPACTPYEHGVVLVVGAHANQPRPDLTAEIVCRLEATVAAEQPVAVVGADGAPWLAQPAVVRPVEGGNAAARANSVARTVATIVATVQGLRPRTGGSDLLAALLLGVDVAHSTATPIADLVVLDAGLPDTGLDLTVPGGTAVDAGEVAAYLATAHGIGGDRLVGLRVEFWSLCETRDPQPALAPAQCDAIRRLWPELVDALGGAGVGIAFPRTGAALDDVPPVRVAPRVEPEAFTPAAGRTLRFDATSALAFAADEARLLDEPAAREALAPVATWLAADPARRAHVVGRTSSADPARNAALSLDRAHVCRDLLVALGAPAGQVSAEGLGYTADPPDRRPDGSLDPVAAAANRLTEVRLS